DGRFPTRRIESQSGTQPHLREEGGLQDGVAHPASPEPILNGTLGALQWEFDVDRGKRDQHEVFDACGFRGIDEGELALAVHGVDRIAGFVRMYRCRRRYD